MLSAAILAARSTVREKKNWHIHLSYVKQDFVACLQLIEEQLRECNGLCEYPLYVKGLILRQQGRIEESLTLFQAATCLNPRSVDNLKQVGTSLFLLGKHKSALEVFDEAAKIDPNDWESSYNRGLCFTHLRQYDKAIAEFENANAIERHDSTYMQLAKVHMMREDYAEALKVYMEALEFNPEGVDLLTNIGLAHLRLQNYQKAFEYLGAALSHDPTNVRAILAAGSIIQNNQDHDVALTKYRIAAAKTPYSPQLWNNIGMCFFGKQKYVAAIACLKRALYLGPFEWLINYNLGLAHLTTEQYASAFHYLSAAANLNPNYGPTYMYLAIVLSRLDEFENACAAYEKSLQLSDDLLTRLNYAVTLYQNDEPERAQEQLQRFDALAKSTPNAETEEMSVLYRELHYRMKSM